ncbi:MAG: hypothetical protein R3208_04060 [Ketobacteraceae bacterium]|nr:hypothetical protein [Ketobacteraceae bacterium]
MKHALASGGFGIVVAVWALIFSQSAWSADTEAGAVPETVQFNTEKTFDFSSQEQLLELPSFGEDPSYLEAGRLIGPITAGTHKGLGKKYLLEKNGNYTDEVEMSFDIHLDENFQVNTHPSEIGKFPGMEGIYDTSAGWGGKPVGTENSWSIRIGHLQQNADGQVPIGLYIYHPHMTSTYGTGVPTGFALETGRTYRLTLYVKLNDVGSSNGVIKLLVDGEEVYSSDSWQLRLADSVHIKSVWLDAYIGGATPSPVDTWVALDNLQIKWNNCTGTGCVSDADQSPPLPPQNVRVGVGG